jgi:hypothetical protein
MYRDGDRERRRNVRGPVAQPGGHDNQQKQERNKTKSFDSGGLSAAAPVPTKAGQKKPPPTREALSCNRSNAKPPAAPTKKYPARSVFIRPQRQHVPVRTEGGGKSRADTGQPRAELLYRRYFPRASWIAERPSVKPGLRRFAGAGCRTPVTRATGRRREWIDSSIEVVPETYKDRKRVANLYGRSLFGPYPLSREQLPRKYYGSMGPEARILCAAGGGICRKSRSRPYSPHG